MRSGMDAGLWIGVAEFDSQDASAWQVNRKQKKTFGGFPTKIEPTYYDDVHLAGTATKYGLNYFPLGYGLIYFVNLEKVDRESNHWTDALYANDGRQQIEDLIGVPATEWKFILRGRHGIQGSWVRNH